MNVVAAAARAAIASDGRLTWTSSGFDGVRRRRQNGSDVVDRRVGRADVDRRRRAGRFEEVAGDRQADDRGPVDLRREGQRLEDADDGEPVAADVDDGADPDVGDAEPAGRRRAEDDRRVAGGRGVEVAPVGERPLERPEERCVRRE